MSGVELAIATGAGKALARSLLSPKVYNFFSTWKLDSSLLDKLEIQLNSVQALLSDAEEKLIEDNTRVDKWAQKARFAIYDAEDLLDGILADVPAGSNKVRNDIITLVESSVSVKDKLKYKLKGTARATHPNKKTIEEELDKLIERLQFIVAQKDVLGLKKKSELALYRKERLSSSFASETCTICGRSRDKEAIMHLLNSREGNDDSLRIISIVGMGGMGKTTLACLVFHEYKSLNRSFGLPSWLVRLVQREDNCSDPLIFDVKGWACVSDEFDATRVIKSLLESITGQGVTIDNSFELVQQQLKEKLHGKRFLVVLDDIWTDDPLNWDVLRTSFSVGAPGSRVIITTRSKNVARIASTSHDFSYELDKMSRSESWSLFEKIVFRDGNSNEHLILKDIGKEIVSRCKGLPLAIKMIGGLLVAKGNDELEWRSVLNNKIWESTKIIPSLLLSYYHLPLGVQNCFAYCSIFPKDYSFSIEEVTLLWVGEGLIEKFCEGNLYEDIAKSYFTHLRSKFFFQESTSGRSKFVMHDLVHDLALHLSRGLCVDFFNVTVQSRRLSYIQGKNESLLNKMSGTKLSHLRTFLPVREGWWNSGYYFNKKLHCELLSNFKLLRVLSLKGYDISALPKSVGDMKLLRYLDLSFTDIDHLPDKICRLYNLQILLLSGCRKLSRLPAEICNLVNLRHLYIDGTGLEKMPDGFGRMTNIRTLSNFVLGRGKSKQMGEFKGLVNLRGKLHISKLNNVDDTKDAVLGGFTQKDYLEELVLEWNWDRARDFHLDEKVLDAMEAHKKLKRLTIKWYGGKRLSSWIVGVAPFFTDLISLSIENCFKCKVLPSLGDLPFLKDLRLEMLGYVKSLGEEFYGDSYHPFPALQKLRISGMSELKRWYFPKGDRVGFQMLKDLEIICCGALTEIPYCFPSLTQLQIHCCISLVKLETCERSSSAIFGHSLQSICIEDCPQIEEIPKIFVNLTDISIYRCSSLISVPRLQHARKIELVQVGDALAVDGDGTQQDCRVLEELKIENSLSRLWFSAKMNRLRSLRLELGANGREDEDGEVVRLSPYLSDFTVSGGGSNLHIHPNILTRLSNLNYLTKFQLFDFPTMESFPHVELPSTITSISICHCDQLRTLPDQFLSGCSKSLQELEIRHCPNLACLPSSLSTVESLQRLTFSMCHHIRQFPTTASNGPHYLTKLSYLDIACCSALECLPQGFQNTTTLHTLYIYRCPNLCIPKDQLPASLGELRITDCGKMKPFLKKGLPTLSSLTYLCLEEFQDISTLDHCLPESIQILSISGFPRLRSLSGVLPNLKHLRRINVHNCPLLKHIP